MKKGLSLLACSLLAGMNLYAIDNLMMTFKYGPSDLSGNFSFNKHTFGLDLTLDTASDIKPKIDLGYLMVDEGGGGVDYTLQLSANALYEGSEYFYGTWLPYMYGGIGYEYVHHERPAFESAPYLQIAGGVEFPLGDVSGDHKWIVEARWMQMLGTGNDQESEAAIFIGFRIATGSLGYRSEAYEGYEEEKYAELEGVTTPELTREREHVVFSDSDGDGVADKDDRCPHTPSGVVVDEMGCSDQERGVSVWKSVPVKSAKATPKTQKVTFQPLPRQRKVMTLLFESDSTKLSGEGREKIREFVRQINKRGYRYITVEGYTDNSGTFAQNIALSKKRAQRVRELMIQYGIDPEKITAVGKGALNPIADNEVPEGRALNRRIEIVVE